MYEPYQQYLLRLQHTGRERKLPAPPPFDQTTGIDFSTNDYLALSRRPELMAAAVAAAERDGVGATGSRLLSGNNARIERLEAVIARDKQTEAALVFNSGFQANMSVLACLLDQKVLAAKPVVLFDRLNHASLYQAVFLSGAELVRYQHQDLNHLSSLLKQYANRPMFVVAETIYGMDGDVLPIEALVALVRPYQAFLYLDEAHATGVIGQNGYGLSTTVDLTDVPHVVMGTFSKALGCSGGYVACSNVLKDYLVNKASGFIYSTAKSPMMVGAMQQAWQMVKDMAAERVQLLSLAEMTRERLRGLGFEVGLSASQIIPILLYEEAVAMKAKNDLLDKQILVSCIRPPTVPPGTSRLRLALTVEHGESDIDKLVDALRVL